VTLRFDFDGTGDSSGGFNDIGRDRLWIESVVEATKYLRSLGLISVSAVGMRLGATLIGVAADRHELDLTSVVLWDPCDSGQSFLREFSALDALRRDSEQTVANTPFEASEFAFSTRSVEEIRRVVLTETTSRSFGERNLIVTRSNRAVSKRLRNHLTGDGVEWRTTDEQESLLDINPMWAALPEHTAHDIVNWLTEPGPTWTPFDVGPVAQSVTVASEADRFNVVERIVELGPERLFGIVSEPEGEIQGPLIVMLNVATEDHTGPSRLWVELSRRWAGFGMRSVRFDMRGLGDSPRLDPQLDSEFFFGEWLDDILTVVRELNPDDASNSVFIGLCSGAYWAIEAALELRARGVCVINPPMYVDALHSIRKLETSSRPRIRRVGDRLKGLVQRRWFLAIHPRMAAATWHLTRVVLPSAYSLDILAKLSDDGTDVLLCYGAEEMWPYNRIPFFRSLDFRRLTNSSNRRLELVPGLDHGMHFAEGRARTVDILDRHVLERFGGMTDEQETGPMLTKDS
jgi:pimeloyl-ACP methyl ester carboxylesterase